MPRVFANGGMIGKTLDFTAATSYTSYPYSAYPDPITYVGYAVGANIGGAVGDVALTSLTGGIGGGVQTGDLVIATVAIGSGSTNYTMSLSTAGYTTLFDLYQSDTRSTNLGVFYKVMGETPDTSVATTMSIGATEGIYLDAHVYRGVRTVTPIGASASAVNNNTVLANPPAITTTVAGSKVFAIGAGGNSTAGGVNYNNSADLTDSLSVALLTVSLALGSVIVQPSGIRASGTSVDPATFTWGASDSASYSWAAATLELIPAKPVTTLMNSGVWDTGWRYGSVAS